MLRMPTNSSPRRGLTTQENNVDSDDHFEHPILKGFRKFWQFSSFYGDYVSQPLERRGNRSTLSQKISR
jgi:hypothetical protein